MVTPKTKDELVECLKNLYQHPEENKDKPGLFLFRILANGEIDKNAIDNLDEIFQYRSVICEVDYKYLLLFLYYFCKYDWKIENIGKFCQYIAFTSMDGYPPEEKELKNVAAALNIEEIKKKEARYIFNLAKQKDFLNKESYTREKPLENYLLEQSIDDISDLKNLLNEEQRILWSKLAPALRKEDLGPLNILKAKYPIKELNTLKAVAKFNEGNKINRFQVNLFGNASVGNWQELFEICDNGAKHDFIFYFDDFRVFKDGAFKNFNLNDTQTLKEYGLIKKSCFRYPLYVLWDIGRIVVWAISFGKCCKYKYKGAAWFEKVRYLCRKNRQIEEAIQRIKENQEKEPVLEQPGELETEANKNQDNVKVTDKLNGFKPKTYDDKNQEME